MIREREHSQRVTIIVIPKWRKDRRKKKVLTSYHLIARDPERLDKVQRSLEEKDEFKAKAHADYLRELVRAGEYDFWEGRDRPLPSSRPISCVEAVESYLGELRTLPGPSGLPIRDTTHRQYAYTLRNFAAWLEAEVCVGMPLVDVKTDHVRKFALGRGLERSTSATQLNTIRAFLQWAFKRRCIRANPAVDLRVLRGGGRLGYFKRAQYEGFLRLLEKGAREQRQRSSRERCFALRTAVVIGVEAGLRRGEICALRWHDVDLDEGLIHVVDSASHRTKNSLSRSVPIAGRLLAMLRELREASPRGEGYVLCGRGGAPFRGGRLTIGFQALAKKAELPVSLTFHSTRHTYATWLAQGGAGMFLIQALLGHSSSQMTQRYTHVSGVDGRRYVDQIFGRAA